MKIIFSLLIAITSVTCYAQCDYFFFQNNKTITLGIFDKKGKEDGKVVYKVSDVKKSGGTSSAYLQSEIIDKKGKSMGGGKGNMQCKNGYLMMDMKMLINPQQMKQLNDVDVEGKGKFLEYPASISVGETLKDAKFDMDMDMGNGLMVNMNMEITNRKVDAKESVTTPAGTWTAYKISYNSKTVMNMGISVPMKLQMTEWFVPNFGVVKSESKWGKTELLSIQ